MTWAEFAAAWSALHGGFDPETASPLVRGWVRLAYRGGSLLGRLRVGPGAVTAVGLLLSAAVPFAAMIGRAGPLSAGPLSAGPLSAGPLSTGPLSAGLLLGGFLVLLASVADGLDGAVAVVSGTVTRLGYVYDSVADRLGEVAWLAAFWVAGAPAWLVVAGGGVSWLHEYVRARATAGGMADIGAVTVGERPTRVSIAVSALVIGGVAGFAHPDWEVRAIVVGAAVWLTLAVIGLGQLGIAVRRELR